MHQIPAWATKQVRIVNIVNDWIDLCAERWGNIQFSGRFTDALFMKLFPSIYYLIGNEKIANLLDTQAQQFIESDIVEACTCGLLPEHKAEYHGPQFRGLYHGYPADQACLHHALLNYIILLAHQSHINPDPSILSFLEDAVEHIGNWATDVTEWYDWENHRFRSIYLGTQRVREYPPYDCESIESVRLILLTLNAYFATNSSKYLDICLDFANRWVDIIAQLDDNLIPVIIPKDKPELYSPLENINKKIGWHFELASLFIDLYRITENNRYLQPVQKMINNYLSVKTDISKIEHDDLFPLILAKYRRFSQDFSFDKIANLYEGKDIKCEKFALGFEYFPRENRDRILYFNTSADGTIRYDNNNVSLLACCYIITKEERFLEASLSIAEDRLKYLFFLKESKDNSLPSQRISSDFLLETNLVGSLLLTALGGYAIIFGDKPWFEIKYQNDKGIGCPLNVAALIEEANDSYCRLTLWNLQNKKSAVWIDPVNIASKDKFVKARVIGSVSGSDNNASSILTCDYIGGFRLDMPAYTGKTVEITKK